jgi:hypothetical protein
MGGNPGVVHWAYFYERSSVERLREFFDHFLLGKSSGVLSGADSSRRAECHRHAHGVILA